MNVANSYKNINLDRDQSFAVTRALGARIDGMVAQLEEAQGGDPKVVRYLTKQIVVARGALQAIKEAQFQGGRV